MYVNIYVCVCVCVCVCECGICMNFVNSSIMVESKNLRLLKKMIFPTLVGCGNFPIDPNLDIF